jgi:hypothetical protein
MIEETKSFFTKVGLEMNKEKSATNSPRCQDEATLIQGAEGYKYLGITEDSTSRTKPETMMKIKEKMMGRVEKLCKTGLSARNMIKAINEYAISLINYYTGVLEVEPEEYRRIDDEIRQILIKYKIHKQPANKERLYLPRSELGRGLHKVEYKSELMILQLKQTLESTKSRSLRREAILKSEREAQTHFANIDGYLRVKYDLKDEELTRKTVEEAQRKRLYSEINSRMNHGKLYRAKLDPVISMEGSTLWLKYSSIKPREEAALCSLQDRNMFCGVTGPCPHCQKRQKTVDHMATQCERMLAHDYMRRHNEALRCIHLQICRNYGLTTNRKIGKHSVQQCIANSKVEIRVDSRIATRINVKYNKPDIFIYDKVKNEIVIVEVGITSFDNLRAVETEKQHKYDYLANHCGAMYKAVRTRIIPYVMTWEGLVTTFHEDYCKELRIDRRTEAYVQTRMLKMTLESISMEYRRGLQPMESHGITDLAQADTLSEVVLIPKVEITI